MSEKCCPQMVLGGNDELAVRGNAGATGLRLRESSGPGMLDPIRPTEQSVWLGRFRIDLINDRGWPASPAEIEMCCEKVNLRHNLVMVAVMPRRALGTWFAEPSDRPFTAGTVTWQVRPGALLLTLGKARYRVAETSRQQIVLLL